MNSSVRFASFVLLIFLAERADALTSVHLWSNRYGAAGSDGANAVTTDPSGNIIVAGTFNGTVSFGGPNLTSAGAFDIFLAKYTPAGSHVWSIRAGGMSSEFPGDIAVDASGNIFVAGSFSGTTDLGGGNLISAGSSDMFLAKYSAGGGFIWASRFGSTFDDVAKSVCVDNAGNVIITGYFTGTVDFGGGGLVSAGVYDAAVAKYSPSGTHQWSHRIGDVYPDFGYAVCTDASNYVVVTGSIGGPTVGENPTSDIFVGRYNSAGAHQWTNAYSPDSYGGGWGVTTRGSDIVVCGTRNGNVSIGGLFLPASLGPSFLVKLSNNGSAVWARAFGTTVAVSATAVEFGQDGHIYLGGTYQAPTSVGGPTLPHAGSDDVFIASYESSGSHRWSRGMGGTGQEGFGGISHHNIGGLTVAGQFPSTANFGGSNLTSAGIYDAFVANYAAQTAEPDISLVTDIGNDQGRHVRIDFARSAHDAAGASPLVTGYEVYRRNDAPPLLSAQTPAGSAALLAEGWSYVGSAPAHTETYYSVVAPTIGDSTVSLGQYHSVFYVRAATEVTSTFFDSPIDSGYSLDNLSPGIPLNLIYTAGDLEWDESSAEDFDFFTVYGSNVDNFGAAVVVDYSVTPTLDVSGSPYVFYYVTATDFSGNEGKPAKVNTLSGAGGTPKSYVLSVSNYPNPFNPRTTVSYTVPSRGAVRVAIYDLRGAYVATLFEGERPSGVYSVDWNGHAAGGAPVSSGIYFARIEHNGSTRSKKMVLLK